ncbi:unnamed protein product, partial [Brenthis ino]
MEHVGRGRSIQRRLRVELKPGTFSPPVISEPSYPSRFHLFHYKQKHLDNRRRSRMAGRLISCQLRKIHPATIILLPVA